MKPIDRTNQRFGKLKVLELLYHTQKDRYWKCKCDCGKAITISEERFTSPINSCGCAIIGPIKEVKTTLTVTPPPKAVPLKVVKLISDIPPLPKKHRIKVKSELIHAAIEVVGIFTVLGLSAYLFL